MNMATSLIYVFFILVGFTLPCLALPACMHVLQAINRNLVKRFSSLSLHCVRIVKWTCSILSSPHKTAVQSLCPAWLSLVLLCRKHDVLWMPFCLCRLLLCQRVACVGQRGLTATFHCVLTGPGTQGVRPTQDHRARRTSLEVAICAASLCLHSRVSGVLGGGGGGGGGTRLGTMMVSITIHGGDILILPCYTGMQSRCPKVSKTA